VISEIHQSSLNMILRCGEQFRRRYLEGDIIPPSVAAARGTGVHKASQVNLRNKIRTKEDLPLADLLDAARDGYVNALKEGVYLPKEDQPSKKRILNNGLEDALRCTRVYREKVAPNLDPKLVEEPFLINLNLELPLAGTIDFVTVNNVLGDLKTSERSWSSTRAQEEIQPIFYSLAYEHLYGTRPRFLYFILLARRDKDGAPSSETWQVEDVEVLDKHYAALLAKISLMIRMLRAAVFPPALPTSWWCSERWCGYYTTCPYVGNVLPGKWV